MILRTATIIVCVLDAAVWASVAFVMFVSGSDPATSGLDEAAGYIVTALFLITAAPALALIAYGRAPRTALTLALVFPVVFAGLFITTILVFA
jgi:hypothetical protein